MANYYNWGNGTGILPNYQPIGLQLQHVQAQAPTPNPSGLNVTVNQPMPIVDSTIASTYQIPCASPERFNVELKVLSTNNKKDYKLYTLRNGSRDLDSPDRLKKEICQQCQDVVPSPEHNNYGSGLFCTFKKDVD